MIECPFWICRVLGMPKLRHINWIDMVVSDPDRTSKFYTDVVGFTRESVKEDEEHTSYCLNNDEGQTVLGVCDRGVFPDWVHGWVPYVDVDNFEQRVANVTALGGEIVKEMSTDYNWPGQRMCLVKDPSGAPMMLCESESEGARKNTDEGTVDS